MSRFVIREVREGPEELRKHLPITGETFDVRSGPDGHTYFCARLDEPIKHRLDAAADTSGYPPEQLESDSAGTSLKVNGIVMRPSDPDVQPYHGMQQFPVDLAYVIDPTYRDQPDLAFDKLLPIAAVEIDDLAENGPAANGHRRQNGHETAIAELLEDSPDSAPPTPRASLRDAGTTDSRPQPAAAEPDEPFRRPTPVAGRPPLPPGQYGTEMPLLPTTLKRSTLSKKTLGVATAACVGAALIGITAWEVVTGAEGSQPAPSVAAEPAPSAADIERVKGGLPKGYSEISCKPASGSVDPSLTCGPNAHPGGPRSATYTIYPNRQALSQAFAAAIATYSRVNCPGNIQSPGPWSRNAIRDKAAGTLFCGIRAGQGAAIVWTDDAKYMLHIAETVTHGTTLDQLYSWWGTHA
ncbi:hypothetical protein [Mycolicibacterium nivoides]|uniref:Serine/threonine protein kinase n=1 Tax=Mycolicibacterium nivoides TaxID=2487344 RepID=A0ABW9LN86_9MYCO